MSSYSTAFSQQSETEQAEEVACQASAAISGAVAASNQDRLSRMGIESADGGGSDDVMDGSCANLVLDVLSPEEAQALALRYVANPVVRLWMKTNPPKVAEPAKPGLPWEWSDPRLRELFALPELTAEQIAEARPRVAALAEPERSAAYQWIQSHSPYRSQRDNASSKETRNGGTCNLTSLAMCLESLGVSSPDPSLALDEYLLSKYDHRELKDHGLWAEIATKEFGRTWRVMNFNMKSRAAWEREVGGALKGGEAVIISVVGHVVRIQEVAATGLVIDDPFGKLQLHKSTPTDNNNYSFSAENPYKGDGARPDEEPAGGYPGDNVASNWKAVTEYTWQAPYAIG